MSNVVNFVTRDTKARSRNRKEALSVIIPRLLALRERAGPLTIPTGGPMPADVSEVRHAGLFILYTWLPDGLNIIVHTGDPNGGPGNFPRVFAVYLNINAPAESASVASWKRGDWEEALFAAVA